MYICPTCQKKFESEEMIRKHFLRCWKEQHPYHKSKEAPHLEDVVTREVDNNVISFFEGIR